MTIFFNSLIILNMKDDILEIAAVCRRACEQYDKTYEYFYSGLGGMCGMASAFLFEKLQTVCSPIFIMGNGGDSHCWVRVGRTNIDITATQFNASVSPVYTFRGKSEEHPLLKRFYKRFPNEWKFIEAKNPEIIRGLLKEWEPCTRYSGKYKKRLDNFF